MSILDKKNTIKPDWDNLPPVRKECQSCFKWFETSRRWAKRCPECKEIDAPYRKKLYKQLEEPF